MPCYYREWSESQAVHIQSSYELAHFVTNPLTRPDGAGPGSVSAVRESFVNSYSVFEDRSC